MDRHKWERNPVYLLLGASGLLSLASYINALPPDAIINVLGFYLILSISVWFLGAYIFRNKRYAALLSIGVVSYLFLRHLGLRHPYYVVLLTASIIAIEYLWKDR